MKKGEADKDPCDIVRCGERMQRRHNPEIAEPFIHTYAAAMMAKIRRNKINTNASKLLAVTLLTP